MSWYSGAEKGAFPAVVLVPGRIVGVFKRAPRRPGPRVCAAGLSWAELAGDDRGASRCGRGYRRSAPEHDAQCIPRTDDG